MMKHIAIVVCASLLLVGEGDAAPRELKHSELRKVTRSGGAIRLKNVIKGVEKIIGGTPVDARAFQADGVYYRILVKKPNGSIISVIVDAKTGVVVPNKSRVGQQIKEAARSNLGNSATAKAQANLNGFSGNRGVGNRGGNGNSGGNSGNSGGGGNGNSGGGKSGGNGGGNSGGNGGGNSGGNGGGNGGGGNGGGNGNSGGGRR
ncbi:PepSY domain-containing protein [Ruegeria sp. HKCCA5491]|uniref:PepSY domain-containing protein n=1 Tax=Ruegeria sp. HKCCA5491 TaxID=2682986 RepID=UPI001488DC3B|nr:hypothetical protein [Ruegeria sp. HKCCA5491]